MDNNSLITPINNASLARAQKKALSDEFVEILADAFKVLGDPTRVKIISALLHQALCVRDISILVGVSESAISHQLRILRHHRLVKQRRQGNVIYYSIENVHLGRFFKEAENYVEHITEGIPDHPDK
jgi:ArsR family transcriptional regulator, lead/cadmium/zinc/bismuth-responsive transcriptional repressor